MKKIWIFVAIAMVITMLMSGFSIFSSLDYIKFDKADKTEKTTSVTTAEPEPGFLESTFYYFDDGSLVHSSSIDEIGIGKRGFFILNDVTYFAITDSGSEEFGTQVYPIDLNYGGYEFCSGITTNMIDVDLEQWLCSSDCFVIYTVIENCEDPVATHNDLLNVNISVSHSDPTTPEGPSAE